MRLLHVEISLNTSQFKRKSEFHKYIVTLQQLFHLTVAFSSDEIMDKSKVQSQLTYQILSKSEGRLK